jgi:nickel-dependent lactate racemase
MSERQPLGLAPEGASPRYTLAPESASPRWKFRTVEPPRAAPLPDLPRALADAIAHPFGARPLPQIASSRTRVVVVVSGAARREPRAELFGAVRAALAAVRDDHLTLAVANGGHPPAGLDRLGLPEEVLRRHRVVNHDARDASAMVDMGLTSRGTRLRVNRCLAEADLVVATGAIRPHHAAGFSGGAKGIFPGLAFEDDVRSNRALADDPASALGAADGNPCREDFEEAVRRLGRDTYAVNVVASSATVVGAVAGDVVYAHREGVRLARPWCEVEARRADCVIVSAPLPLGASLVQAAKLVSRAGLLLRPGGTAILAAECRDGVGGRAGVPVLAPFVRRWLPEGSTLLVVSSLDEQAIAAAGGTWAPDLEHALAVARARAGDRELDVAVIPDGSDVVPRPT